jgi:gamma-glutamyl:cysteine ligase YbdK (ATP-grasp superfamily)
MTIGTEHEYSINDRDFRPLPINDKIIEEINREVVNEFQFGDVNLSKELQKNVIEIVPTLPGTSVQGLEKTLYGGLQQLYAATQDKYRFLGLGMHPLLKLEQTAVWDHEDKEIYQVYDRLFDIKQHGWLNIQAIQINVPFKNGEEMVQLFNRTRAIIPYLVAIGASSPFVEGKLTDNDDNRLIFYRENQRKMPILAHGVIPEKLRSMQDYLDIQQEMYRELRKQDAEILCHEWVDSRGVIVRFSSNCVEIKAIDEQECLHSDMAITALSLALLRSKEFSLTEDEGDLRSLTEEAIHHGTANLKPELRQVFELALKGANQDERSYLALIKKRIEQGSLAELMREQAAGGIRPILEDMAESLRTNVPYRGLKASHHYQFGPPSPE